MNLNHTLKVHLKVPVICALLFPWLLWWIMWWLSDPHYLKLISKSEGSVLELIIEEHLTVIVCVYAFFIWRVWGPTRSYATGLSG